MDKRCLINRTCVPCQDAVPPLDRSTTEKLLAEIGTRWQIDDIGHLYKKYLFNDFQQSLDFANRIAQIAEKEAHHPDLTKAWGNVS